jgi:hypothetical protein
VPALLRLLPFRNRSDRTCRAAAAAHLVRQQVIAHVVYDHILGMLPPTGGADDAPSEYWTRLLPHIAALIPREPAPKHQIAATGSGQRAVDLSAIPRSRHFSVDVGRRCVTRSRSASIFPPRSPRVFSATACRCPALRKRCAASAHPPCRKRAGRQSPPHVRHRTLPRPPIAAAAGPRPRRKASARPTTTRSWKWTAPRRLEIHGTTIHLAVL